MSNRYEITSLIETDRMGEVFLALDITLQRKVVFRKFNCQKKGALPDELTKYTGKLCALQHPNLLTIFDIGYNDEGSFMVTQFIEAEKLVDRLQQGPLSQTGVYNMASDLLDALHALHVVGLVHGALRSDSVKRLARVRGGHRYLLVDTGLEKIASMICDGNEESADTVLMAPELLTGDAKPDVRSDLFALGQLCFIALAGGHPLAGCSEDECAEAYRDGGIPSLQEYAVDTQQNFIDWVMALIAVDPNQRPASTDEAMASLHAISINAPAPNIPGVTQAVVEVAPQTQVQSSISVSDEQTSASAVDKLKALPKNVKVMIGGGVFAFIILLIVVILMGFGGKNAGDDAESLSNRGPVFLNTPTMVQVKGDGDDPLLIELDTAKMLDWSVVKGVPSSSEKIDKKEGTYITSIFTHGNFKEFISPDAQLSFHGNGETVTPHGAMTNVDKGMAEFGEGWDIMLHIPKGHTGPLVVTLYMMQDECDFKVTVKMPKKKEVQMEVSYDSVGEEAGEVKIPLEISNPIPGEFYTITILSASEDPSQEFGMALSAVLVTKR